MNKPIHYKYRRVLPFLLCLIGVAAVLASLTLFTHPSPVSANSEEMPAALVYYPDIVGTRIESCALCHTADGMYLNPYGEAYKAHGRGPNAFAAIESLDSDGDGFSNIQEIKARTFPGFSNDRPGNLGFGLNTMFLPLLASAPSLASAPISKPTPVPTPPSGSSGDPTLVGAGDIAICGNPGAEATAKLLDKIPGTIFTAGDNSNDSGTASEYANCFNPAWGRHKARIRPAVGNHDYLSPNAAPYFAYFGAAAGDPNKGYYSYDVGSWHVVVINSNCSKAGGCKAGSPQEQWLKADLAAHPSKCTLAVWHHPRFSSGQQGNYVSMQDIWQALYTAGAELVINGHDHVYERFAPQDPSGRADPSRGIREFIVGTGGASHNPFKSPIANSEVRIKDVFGLLKLTLQAGSYSWQFVPEAGKTQSDSGSTACH